VSFGRTIANWEMDTVYSEGRRLYVCENRSVKERADLETVDVEHKHSCGLLKMKTKNDGFLRIEPLAVIVASVERGQKLTHMLDRKQCVDSWRTERLLDDGS